MELKGEQEADDDDDGADAGVVAGVGWVAETTAGARSADTSTSR